MAVHTNSVFACTRTYSHFCCQKLMLTKSSLKSKTQTWSWLCFSPVTIKRIIVLMIVAIIVAMIVAMIVVMIVHHLLSLNNIGPHIPLHNFFLLSLFSLNLNPELIWSLTSKTKYCYKYIPSCFLVGSAIVYMVHITDCEQQSISIANKLPSIGQIPCWGKDAILQRICITVLREGYNITKVNNKRQERRIQ